MPRLILHLLFTSAVLMVNLPTPLVAQDPQLAAKFEKRVHTSAKGDALGYRFLAPAELAPGQKYPLVVFLHGAGERGDDNAIQLIHGVTIFATPEFLKKYPCYVVAPQAPKNTKWTDIDWSIERPAMPEAASSPMRLLVELLDSLEKQLPIDVQREYVTGLSMGGFGTWDMILRQPNRFAAAVPVCGGVDTSKLDRVKHVQIWLFHGAKDQAVKVERSREAVEALHKLGVTIKYTEYPEVGHDSWVPAYKDPALYEWLFAQKLPAQN